MLLLEDVTRKLGQAGSLGRCPGVDVVQVEGGERHVGLDRGGGLVRRLDRGGGTGQETGQGWGDWSGDWTEVGRLVTGDRGGQSGLLGDQERCVLLSPGSTPGQ